ncbi:MAG: AarF/ABC1/UbiB kinase family protein [Lentisphaerae bacterium]|nr:AarF/ABC1/UbiB kinase family protein [Lentisphaerota bacterium]
MSEFTKLQDRVTPFPFDQVEEIIRQELKGEISTFFSEFSPEPIGSASIAQGHHARLLDGSEVFVKIRRPGIEESIRADLEILAILADFLEKHNAEIRFLQPSRIVAEFSRSLEDELNLDLEYSNICRFARQFKGREGLVVPKVYPRLCTPKILTMEFIHGCKGTDLEQIDAIGIDRKKISALGAELLLEQFFVHGFYHADPHPGNVFILPGDRICYVDFGQIGRCSLEERECFARLLVAVVRRQEKTAARLLLRLSEFQEEPNQESIERDLAAYIDRFLYRPLRELRVSSAVQEFYQLCQRHQLGLKPHIYLILKAMGVSDEMGRQLDPEFNILEHLQPFIRKAVLRSFNPVMRARRMREISDEMLELLRGFPQRQRIFWRQLLEGRLVLNQQLIGLEQSQRLFNHACNRLCLALVQVGLLSASAIIIHARIGPKLWDIPIIGLIGIILSCVLFAAMVFDMVHTR